MKHAALKPWKIGILAIETIKRDALSIGRIGVSHGFVDVKMVNVMSSIMINVFHYLVEN